MHAANLLSDPARTKRFGLEDRQAAFHRQALDRAFDQMLAPAGGAIRSGENERDLMTGRLERRERLLGEFRRAGED